MSGLPSEIPTRLLLLLLLRGKMTMSQLQSETRFSTITVQKHVKALIQLGLITEEKETCFPRKRYISLSNEGQRIAKIITVAGITNLDLSELMEIGAKAGRIASYQEMLFVLREKNPQREYLIAELLTKGVEGLASSLSLFSKTLPKNATAESAAIDLWSKKLHEHSVESRKLLAAGNLNGCANQASKALNEFYGARELLERLSGRLKENKLEELTVYVDFLKPKQTQKE